MSLKTKVHKSVQDDLRYPPQAYEFVHDGVGLAMRNVHGPEKRRHISGAELCDALREAALNRWGLMATAVLSHWNINSTFDFGRIVYQLVGHKVLSVTEDDRVEDFLDVFNFKTGFSYRVPSRPESE